MSVEKKIEHAFRVSIEDAGGEAFKFVCPSRNGMPDRLVLLGLSEATLFLVDVFRQAGISLTPCKAEQLAQSVLARCVRFAEIKAPGEKPRPDQERAHARLRSLGICVDVIDGTAH